MDRNTIGVDAGKALLYVALREESVDRNVLLPLVLWDSHGVALREESVDRNRECWHMPPGSESRSPRGERG